VGAVFATHVHHVGLALGVKMGQDIVGLGHGGRGSKTIYKSLFTMAHHTAMPWPKTSHA
jgi:hypothetical protein